MSDVVPRPLPVRPKNDSPYKLTVLWDLEEASRESGGVDDSSVNPNSDTQSSPPSPTQRLRRSRLDILIWLALGITAHDIAVVEGVHIPGYHAMYFSVPMIGILLSVKLERRIVKWLK